MTMTGGKDKKNPGKFRFEIHTGFNDLVEFGGGYPTFQECQDAGQFAYRAYHYSGFTVPQTPIENNYISLDDILAGLED